MLQLCVAHTSKHWYATCVVLQDYFCPYENPISSFNNNSISFPQFVSFSVFVKNATHFLNSTNDLNCCCQLYGRVASVTNADTSTNPSNLFDWFYFPSCCYFFFFFILSAERQLQYECERFHFLCLKWTLPLVIRLLTFSFICHFSYLIARWLLYLFLFRNVLICITFNVGFPWECT